jgi:hypothetical protein
VTGHTRRVPGVCALLAAEGWLRVRLHWRMVFISPAETTKIFGGVVSRARARQYSLPER